MNSQLTGTTAYRRFVSLAESPILSLLVVLVAVIALRGIPVPEFHETRYLLEPRIQWDPEFLASDWTLSQPEGTHYLFNLLVGPLTLVLPFGVVGWIGRILCWSLAIWALLKVGRGYGLKPPVVACGIVLFLVSSRAPYTDTVVGTEELFSAFQAKTAAYVLVLFAIYCFARSREMVGALLLGSAFSMHAAVGLWSAAAVAISLVALRYPVRRILRVAALGALTALPGIMTILPLVLNGPSGSADSSRFLVLVLFPSNLDAAGFQKRDLYVLYVMSAFSALHFYYNKHNELIRFLFVIQAVLCGLFTIGIVWRYLNLYGLLTLFPFRLAPIIIPCLFWFALLSSYRLGLLSPAKRAISTLAFLAVLSVNEPLSTFADRARATLAQWRAKETDLQHALRWISMNTEESEVGIMPPWEPGNWYFARRGQIACVFHPSLSNLEIWRERVEALVGSSVLEATGEPLSNKVPEMERYYNALSEQEVAEIARQYGGAFIVTGGRYSFPVLFETERYRVYSLRGLP